MIDGLIPTVIVGGYLGAGKTTLINAFLRDPKGVRATVLVNDFGAINIDAELIRNNNGDTIALTNGCACCSIGDSLLEAAQAVTSVAAPPDLILIEASGISHPTRMAAMLMGVSALAPAICLTVVNGQRWSENLRDKYIGRLYSAQIEAADALCLNRFDPASLLDFEETFGHTRCVTSIGSISFKRGAAGKSGIKQETMLETTGGYRSTTLFLSPPTPLESLVNWLKRMPDGVERIKGSLLVETSEGKLIAKQLNYTQGLFELTPVKQEDAINLGMLIVITRDCLGDTIGKPE